MTRRFLRTRIRALKRALTATVTSLRRVSRRFALGIRARLVVFASLQEAAEKIRTLQLQVAAAQEQIAAYQQRERLLAQALQSAEQVASELTEAATASVEEMVWRARATTDEIARTAREAAAQTLKDAQAAADETHRAGRARAAAALEEARGRAQHEVDAIERDAGGQIEPLQAAADRLAADAERMVLEMEARVRAAADALSAKVGQFEADREEYSQGLAALIARHAETVERVTHLQADVQDSLIPALNRLVAGLKGADTSWLRLLADKDGPGRDRRARAAHEATRPVTVPASHGDRRHPSSRMSGDVNVRHVNSFRQAALLVRALGQLSGVEAVRLRAYTSGEATFEVTVGHGTLADLEIRHLDGFSVDVIEVTPTRLILQIERRQHSYSPG
jgi:cell division septum initiation protein DivIVA